MTKFASKSGSWNISVGSTPSRAETPILEMDNLINNNVVKVTANFFAKTSNAGMGSGFYYTITAAEANDITPLTPSAGVFQGTNGWQSCTLIGFFKVNQTGSSPTEDIDFEVVFSKGDLNGEGSLHNFTLTAEVVPVLD